jgi:hypothetical protein
MEPTVLPVGICSKCHGHLPQVRDKRTRYCSEACKETAMKRRRRGQPVADPVSAEMALALSKRVGELEETVRAASVLMYRARDSRDSYRAKVRAAEAAVATERRRAGAVVAEQAAKTSAMRDQLVDLRRRLADAERTARERVPAAADDGVVAGLRSRLADGNTAYAKLMAVHEQLRSSFDQVSAQARGLPEVYRAWDRLCQKLYQSTKGKPATEAEQRILSQWVSWRNQQQQSKAKAGQK